MVKPITLASCALASTDAQTLAQMEATKEFIEKRFLSKAKAQGFAYKVRGRMIEVCLHSGMSFAPHQRIHQTSTTHCYKQTCSVMS